MSLSFKQNSYEYIRQRILDGSLKAGDPLSYRELAKDVGVSATPVREAISRLESEGLVDQLPRVGAFVKRMSRGEIRDLYELREALEGHAALLAAERITADQMCEIKNICAQMRELLRGRKNKSDWDVAGTTKRMGQLDIKFHMLIVTAAGNLRIAKQIDDFQLMRTVIANGRSFIGKIDEQNHVRTVYEHRRIAQSLCNRDAQSARYWMLRHISYAKKLTIELAEESAAGGWSDTYRHAVSQMERYL